DEASADAKDAAARSINAATEAERRTAAVEEQEQLRRRQIAENECARLQRQIFSEPPRAVSRNVPGAFLLLAGVFLASGILTLTQRPRGADGRLQPRTVWIATLCFGASALIGIPALAGLIGEPHPPYLVSVWPENPPSSPKVGRVQQEQ